MDVVWYKIVDSKLYVAKDARASRHREVAEEMIAVMLAFFALPDMDFLLHFGDGCTHGLPAISWNACRQYADAGFTMPSYTVWERSLGPLQMRAFHQCLADRYPKDQRVPIAFWRGSTTDTVLGSFNKDNYLQALRVQLHLKARNHSDVLDVKIANLLNCDDAVRAAIPDTGNNVAFEDFNKHCLIVDVDGNGWSDRFGQLVHFSTPILKIASNFTAFFEHLYAPGHAIAQYSRDLSDLAAKARELVADCKAGGGVGRGLVDGMQSTTRALMDHMGILQGFAYTLEKYHELSAWDVSRGLEGLKAVETECCQFSKLPSEVVRFVQAHSRAGR